jgi:tripartite-type tricarboxylate transporter receptor subunit TctC
MLRLVLTFVLAATLGSAATAQSDATDAKWPNRPIRLIVPLPAGSAADVIARVLGHQLSVRLAACRTEV